MGGSTTQQIFAGMISVSIPMAILQSTSTQNDLVTAQWLICFVLMGFNLIQEPRNYLWTIATGLSLGLACLTKATAFIFALPFCVWFGILLIRKSLKTVVAGLAIGILVLLINAGFFMRNTLLFSNPLGSTVMFDNTNEIHTFSALASNMIRNTALNFIDNQDALSRSILSWLQLLHENIF
jgi:4-amino-4-deoxy-L-arabinose transferase-like glycosyltransferase